ncbi:hypothetical protein Purlil1_4282 [Purpureocillium lilacinum]|uniref:Uncharacterized protein n=1 Tax=Purpureocillium lilacinum TaxID=33203 RepID=A0ABR0C5M1_PURLI|nr:hypothetical protein Purlil1_4282 [Purpureocillium lilacinum]
MATQFAPQSLTTRDAASGETRLRTPSTEELGWPSPPPPGVPTTLGGGSPIGAVPLEGSQGSRAESVYMLGSPHADSTGATAGRENGGGWLALIACALVINLQPSASMCSPSAEMAAQPAAWRSPASHKGSHGSTAAGIAASTATALPQGPLRGEQTASRDRGSGPGQCVSFVGRTRPSSSLACQCTQYGATTLAEQRRPHRRHSILAARRHAETPLPPLVGAFTGVRAAAQRSTARHRTTGRGAALLCQAVPAVRAGGGGANQARCDQCKTQRAGRSQSSVARKLGVIFVARGGSLTLPYLPADYLRAVEASKAKFQHSDAARARPANALHPPATSLQHTAPTQVF